MNTRTTRATKSRNPDKLLGRLVFVNENDGSDWRDDTRFLVSWSTRKTNQKSDQSRTPKKYAAG
jgi:hypothetical protein